MSVCTWTPDKVNEAFLQAPPLIADTIRDLSIQYPSFMQDIAPLKEFPVGQGSSIQELQFRGSLPSIERGFGSWKKINDMNAAGGCTPCDPPTDGYNWHMLGGHGLSRQVASLMEKDLRTPEYSIPEIQTTKDFEELFAKIVENFWRQISFHKEQNINFNFLTSIAKKYVVDSQGPKANPTDPYKYRSLGNSPIRISTLNLALLTFFYENIRYIPDVVPAEIQNSRPVYFIVASDLLLDSLWLNEPNLRQDLRFSSYANDLVTKYNFMSTIKGMFIPVPYMFTRRFKIVSGEPVEIPPYLNNVPAEVGAFSAINPEYLTAQYEEVLIHGVSPFSIYTYPRVTSLPGGATFGAEPEIFDSLKWINPMTTQDPFQRRGYFATTARIGLSAQYSEGVFGILVERPSVALSAQYTLNPVCPIDPPTCTNVVPTVSCPCPVVLSISPNPMTAGQFFLTFATPVTGTPGNTVNFTMDTGAVITGTLNSLTADGLTGAFTFSGSNALTKGACSQVLSVACIATGFCSSLVTVASDCRSGATNTVTLTLNRPLKVTTGVIRVYFGDCSQQDMSIVSVNAGTNQWVVQYAAGFGPTDNPTGAGGPPATNSPLNEDIICNRAGIIKVCVPPTTDATCPSCDISFASCTGAQA